MEKYSEIALFINASRNRYLEDGHSSPPGSCECNACKGGQEYPPSKNNYFLPTQLIVRALVALDIMAI
jgi:hypothetical protein